MTKAEVLPLEVAFRRSAGGSGQYYSACQKIRLCPVRARRSFRAWQSHGYRL